MKLKHLFVPTLLLASCVAQPKYQDVTLEGPAADTAFHEWSAALPTEFSYPVDYHLDLDFTISGIPEMGGAEMKFLVGSDAAFESSWDYRSRTDLTLAVMGQEMGLQIGASSDANELRVTLDNADMLAMMFGMDLPSGVSLSTDRLRLVWDLVMHLTEVSMEAVEGYEDFGNWTETITGFGDFAHPMLNSRYLAMSPVLNASRWQIEGDSVQVDFAINQEVFSAMMSSPDLAQLGLDLSTMDSVTQNMKSAAHFNVIDGSMSSMVFSGAVPLEDEFGSVTNIEFSITVAYAPLDGDVGPIEFSDPDTAMDLNEPFDQYWPMVEAMMPMLEEQMRQQMMTQNGDDAGDFDF
jgi:hypothetical protein